MRRAASALIGLGLAGFVATYAFFVCTAAGQRLDDRLHVDGTGRASWRLLRAFDAHLVALEIAVLVTILVSTAVRRELRRGLLCVAMPVVMVVLADAGKAVLVRPHLADDWTHTALNTFPSGHVGFTAATVAAVLLAVPVFWRPLVAVAGLPSISLVLLATLQAHWHRASDGIGSVFLVLALSGAVLLLSPARPDAAPPSPADRRRELVTAG